MSNVHDRGTLDWLAELAGAAAPAMAAAFAASRLAPLYGLAMPGAVLIGGGGAYAIAFLAMRAIPAEPRHLSLQAFDAVIEDELLLDEPWQSPVGELLLDQRLESTDAVAELLLDDPLPPPSEDSRVVQLFADGRMPSAGQLKSRIDSHLADRGKAAPVADASDSLSEALAELRRSLRQA